MVILITVFLFAFSVIGFKKYWDEDVCGWAGVGGLFGIVAIAVLCGLVINGRAINAKITMYEEENQRIETELDALVEQYMNYESDTYGDLKGESSITLVSLYPELKADSLVERQIDVYTSNNSKIRELKEKLINISNYKWWLYFGK